jgi:MFS family permease
LNGQRHVQTGSGGLLVMRMKDSLAGHIRSILLTLIFASFIGITYGFGYDLFSLLIPYMKDDLRFSYAEAGLLSAAGRVGFLAGGLIVSPLVNSMGHGRVVILSAALSSLCILAFGAVPNATLVGLLQFVIGICAATVYIPMVVVVSHFIADRHRGKSFGMISSGQAIFVFLNGFLAPLFLISADWRGLWIVVGIVSLLVIAIATLYLLRIGVFSLPREDRTDPSDRLSSGRMAVTSQMVLIWLLIFCSGLITQPYQTYISSFLQDELDLSVSLVSNVWTVLGLARMISGLVVGAVADRVGIRNALMFCYALLCSGCLALSFLVTPPAFVFAGAVYGLAYYPIYGLFPALISKNWSRRDSVFVFGVANVFLGLGGAAGNFAGGYIKSLTGTFVHNYMLSAGICVVLLGAASMLRARKGPPVEL